MTLTAHRRSKSLLRAGALIFAVAGPYGFACSAGDDTTADARHDASGTSGTSGAGGTSGSGGRGGRSGSGNGPDACADEEYAGEQKPLDMYVMFDQSGSMNEAAGSETRWSVIKQALKDFVQSDGTDSMGVGIQYFPRDVPVTCDTPGPECLCIDLILFKLCVPLVGGTCNTAAYSRPEVPIEPLSSSAQKIAASLDAHGPGGGTPTSAALAGAIEYSTQWAAAHPDRKTIVVLATDGEPRECDRNIANIAGIAARGLAANPPVETHVIGVGSSLGALNAIAAGGGGRALIIDGSTANAGQQFRDAMNAIRAGALGCDFALPQAAGRDLDYDTLNVTYTPSGATTPEIVYKAASEAQCSTSIDGWYFTDPLEPKGIRLCPKTCETVKARAGRVRLKVGCTRSVEIPE